MDDTLDINVTATHIDIDTSALENDWGLQALEGLKGSCLQDNP